MELPGLGDTRFQLDPAHHSNSFHAVSAWELRNSKSDWYRLSILQYFASRIPNGWKPHFNRKTAPKALDCYS